MTKSISDFSRSHIGDRVWSPFGPEVAEGETNGEIKRAVAGGDLAVKTDDGVLIHFWHDGLFCKNDSFPTLFWSRPHVEIPPPPRRKVKKWIAFFKGHDGKICLHGIGMHPFFFDTKETAKAESGYGAPEPVEIEVEDED